MQIYKLQRCLTVMELPPERQNNILVPKSKSGIFKVYREFCAIKPFQLSERSLRKKGERIAIQQDVAKPHGGKGNLEYFMRELHKCHRRIEFETQPGFKC